MADTIFGSGNDQWVCPNDRQLALRAKLQTGWSVHTYQTEKQRRSQRLSPAEMEAILQVIQRAERLDTLEQQRIGRLVERLETMRQNVMGNGLSQCLLCGEVLGFLGSSSVFCRDCRKIGSLTAEAQGLLSRAGHFQDAECRDEKCSSLFGGAALKNQNQAALKSLGQKVCTKCGIEASPGQKRPLWLCKICSEQREVWKRSGAWFYKGIPKYILPLKTPSRADDPRFQPFSVEPTEPEPRITETGRVYTWARGRVVSSNSDSDSDLSSSSLEDRLPPSGTRDKKGNKPVGEAGGSMESPRMGLTRAPSHLSGSQSSLARETGTSSADPQGHSLPQPEPRGPGKRQTWATPRC
ncbi:Rab effector Noc2 [Heterocephalus glaber]|uniref:Rab effector Noc2 n=1 Tax=Heterocephalus glaber TaxID=10181 RepID=G5BVL0_HETGA|nr:Rab effector Noc2 [Heterocephalus glaber]